MPRATFGGRNTDFATMKDLVYNHTTAMPKFEEQRPGSRLRMGNFNPLRLSEGQLKEIYDWAHDDLGFRPELQAQLAPISRHDLCAERHQQWRAGQRPDRARRDHRCRGARRRHRHRHHRRRLQGRAHGREGERQCRRMAGPAHRAQGRQGLHHHPVAGAGQSGRPQRHRALGQARTQERSQ